ncbi:hypothetical protein GCM10009117_03700 [Gangjinia marincola]|uniref:Glycosyl transferase family 1 domain-containing protein n=1 Tax=Gangjinia marincola TaxID=578463 RepID=A0ABN1MDP4_9FLAO
MKIGLVLSNPPAYSETFFNAKIKGLQERGFSVTLYVDRHDKKYKLSNVRSAPYAGRNLVRLAFSVITTIIAYTFYTSRLVKFWKLERDRGSKASLIVKKMYLFQHVLKAKADWLHFGFGTMAVGKEYVAEAIDAKMAVSLRGFDINVYPLKHTNIYHLMWSQLDKVHSISNDLLEKAYALGLPKKCPIQIITPAIKVCESIDTNMDFSKPVELLTIARLHYIKNIDILIEAAYQLRESGFDFVWNVIGNGDERDWERYLFHIHQRNLENHVFLLGKKSHKDTLIRLKQCDMYVQTSYTEGFCNALLEAQGYGKLCISFDTGALKENILEGETGWVVKNYTAEDLKNKIIEIYNLPQHHKERVLENARQRVKVHFNLEKQKEEFAHFYQN